MGLANTTAVVTGSSRGIGRAIAERLAEEGCRVVVTGRDEKLLATIPHPSIALDLREPDAAEKLTQFALDELGHIDIVVNNAGATKRGEFLDLTDADFQDGFALKYFGAVRMTRAAWPHLRASGGSMVYISGVGGRTPGAQFTIGGSVNAALLSFTKAMAETGIRDGVQVNCVNPGTIRTDRMKNRLKTAEDEAAFVRESRVTKIGDPADIAALVAFLVSPEGRFLHGSLIDADGGATKSV